MKKFSILLLFFTLCILHSSVGFGQRIREFSKEGSITLDTIFKHRPVRITEEDIVGDTLLQNGGSISIGDGRIPNLNAVPSGRITISGDLTHSTRHYYEKNGERYYIENVPPTLKGKRIDDSNVWLLNDEVAQAWH